MNAIDELTESFSRLPGIGKKSAGRLVNFILKADTSYVKKFALQLNTLQEKIKPCSVCGTWTEDDPCPICTDTMRDRSIICVVEQPQDVSTIESSHEFNGLFHVLGGVIAPLEGIGPDQLNIKQLIKRITEEKVSEVIIATNPTVEGDTTALYLQRMIAAVSDIKVTRLASGLPVGGDLEYADKLTLARSFRGRTEV
ncbi:MAG: recombination protein RecR [Treponema sp.]|uniref:recombination mediator RecR n=1 Tax=Treponema sp. TaxID=166 RepID=UPI001B6D24DE|nr:recombination mediator RecR [Treponema sp.]MBP5587588.1 recombination protein RecR [Treponema sp.]MBR0155488.1 recombination protein RecR [Treponema sp.]MCR5385712.1 recombination mediator RecR [Treponema sp.]